MKIPWHRRFPWVALVTPTAAGAALLVAATGSALAPRGSVGDPWLFTGALVAAGAAAVHRPLAGASVGLGAAVLLPAVVVLGPVPAAWVAAGAVLVAELAHRALARFGPDPYPERRRLVRSLETAAAPALAALAAGSAWTATAPLPPLAAEPGAVVTAAAAATGAYLAVLTALRLAEQWLHRPGARPRVAPVAAPLAVDAAGWAVGGALAMVAADVGEGVAGILVAAWALAALEAVRNAHLRRLSRHRAAELAEVSRAGQRLAGARGELAGTAARIHLECAKVIPFHWLELRLAAGDEAGRRWFTGPDGLLREGAARPPASPPPRPGIHKRSPWRLLDLPLREEGRLLAQLKLWCDPREVEAEAVRLLEALLPQLAASLHRALLDHEARHDALTGTVVRRVLERQLEESFAASREHGRPLAVVICDLDHFKRINDTFGHAGGDQALAAVARLLLGRTRDGDLCCRWGGEEFVLLLEDTDGPTALALAERLRREVEALELDVEGRPLTLTLSAGVAAFPDLVARDAHELLLLADGALYVAKHQGRNLCLLDLGRGRLRTPGGEVLTLPDTPAAPEPPRLFA